jgi:hypothetical protein
MARTSHRTLTAVTVALSAGATTFAAACSGPGQASAPTSTTPSTTTTTSSPATTTTTQEPTRSSAPTPRSPADWKSIFEALVPATLCAVSPLPLTGETGILKDDGKTVAGSSLGARRKLGNRNIQVVSFVANVGGGPINATLKWAPEGGPAQTLKESVIDQTPGAVCFDPEIPATNRNGQISLTTSSPRGGNTALPVGVKNGNPTTGHNFISATQQVIEAISK